MSTRPFVDYVGMNDLPDVPATEGQVVWVRMGDGWFARYVGQGGKWVHPREPGDTWYEQE